MALRVGRERTGLAENGQQLMKHLVITIILLVAAQGAVAEADTSLVSNGDFETGDLSSWTWTPDAGSEPLMVAEVASFDGSLAFRVNPGNDFGEGGPEKGGTLSQPLSLEAGATYRVIVDTLAIQEQNTFDGNRDGGTISVSLGGTLLHTLDVETMAAGEIVTDSFSALFEADVTGNAPLELRFTRAFRNKIPPPPAPPNIYHYADGVHVVLQPTPGDMNGDTVFDDVDVNLFVQALVNRAAYETAYPMFDPVYVGDVNDDDQFNLGDVGAFRSLFGSSGGVATAVPEASCLTLFVCGLTGLFLSSSLRRKRVAPCGGLF